MASPSRRDEMHIGSETPQNHGKDRENGLRSSFFGPFSKSVMEIPGRDPRSPKRSVGILRPLRATRLLLAALSESTMSGARPCAWL